MPSGAAILAFVALFCPATGLSAPPSETGRRPYVVHSADQALERQFHVRHRLGNKFTTALSPREAGRLRALGLTLTPVALLQPSKPRGACDPWPACKDGGTDDGGTTAERVAMPSDPTPWGIEVLYNDPGVATTSGGAGVRVAVLDTGVAQTHPDLSRRILECVDFTGGGPPGAVRIRLGSCDDQNGHGTHVIGTIAADGGADGLGIFGVAPQADILAYKVCGNGCWADDIAAAIDYAAQHGAHIISMSLGGDAESTLIREALDRNPSPLVIAAAGNDGPSIGSIDFPAADARVVAVAATDQLFQTPSWSSRGVNDGDYVVESAEVEFAAPGADVESTWPDGGYRLLAGTSMATPHVAGLAAKLWSGSAADTRASLQGLAGDLDAAGDDPATGFGLPTLP